MEQNKQNEQSEQHEPREQRPAVQPEAGGGDAHERMRQREESLDRREAEVTRRELRAKALETLSARQLPAELAQLLDYQNEEACTASLSRVQKTWQQAVQRGVEARVAGAAPKAGTGKGGLRTGMRDALSAYYGRR